MNALYCIFLWAVTTCGCLADMWLVDMLLQPQPDFTFELGSVLRPAALIALPWAGLNALGVWLRMEDEVIESPLLLFGVLLLVLRRVTCVWHIGFTIYAVSDMGGSEMAFHTLMMGVVLWGAFWLVSAIHEKVVMAVFGEDPEDLPIFSVRDIRERLGGR